MPSKSIALVSSPVTSAFELGRSCAYVNTHRFQCAHPTLSDDRMDKRSSAVVALPELDPSKENESDETTVPFWWSEEPSHHAYWRRHSRDPHPQSVAAKSKRSVVGLAIVHRESRIIACFIAYSFLTGFSIARYAPPSVLLRAKASVWKRHERTHINHLPTVRWSTQTKCHVLFSIRLDRSRTINTL